MKMATATSDLLESAIEEWRDDPAYFFSHALQCETLPLCDSPLVEGGLWEGEREILSALNRAIAEHKPLYIGSGHALGKDFLAGGIPIWFQATRYPAKTLLTGPKHEQVVEITFNELIRHMNRWNPTLPPVGGRLLDSKWELNEEHFILTATTSHSERHVGRLQGFHSPNILIIVTEAQAVPNSVKEQLDGLTTSGQVLFIALGNPLVTTGWFSDGLRSPHKNIVINLDCEKSPNVIEGREVIPGLCSRAWVEDARRNWYAENPNHPLWLSKVKGQLPTTSVNSVFARAMFDPPSRLPAALRPCISLGVDPAEFGDDESAFYRLDGGRDDGVVTTSKHEPTDTAGRAQQMVLARQAEGGVICIDRLGVGAGVASILREEQQEKRPRYQVVSVNFGEKPTNPFSPYHNRRAECYFWARDMLVQGRVEPPKDQTTIEELCETLYFFNSRGKMLLESKDEIKERLGRSPDRADAWVLAVWGLRAATPMPSDEPKAETERFWDAVRRDTRKAVTRVEEEDVVTV